jgi:DNA polymerase-3 subunit epsilon
MQDVIHFFDRPLAITDVETTGRDRDIHEIIDIGLVLADQRTLQVIEEWGVRILPTRLDLAEPEALAVNGYTAESWRDAIPLAEAMAFFATKTAGAVFASFNVSFDWKFVEAALKRTGVKESMDYHRFCLMSSAWDRMREAGERSMKLDAVSVHLGIPEEPKPHHALTGARQAYAAYKKLRGL